MNRKAIVVGSGPNGLSAAIVMARAGFQVTVLEAADEIGGGCRTSELTLPGFRHDLCSAIHPLAAGSPFFATLPLSKHGLHWVHPDIPLAHPFDDGTAAVLHRSMDETARGLGRDGAAYDRMMRPFVRSWPKLARQVLAPVVRWPRHPLLGARFGFYAVQSASGLARRSFRREHTRALFAGLAAHVPLPLERRFSASSALVLGAAAHAVGWPVARGGSQSIANALASYLRSLGGEISTGHPVRSLEELADADAVLLDITPRQLADIAGQELSVAFRRQLTRYRYGPGVFKLDIALDGPIPWAAEACRRAGTLHLGPTLDDIAASERAVASGEHPSQPYVLVGQQSLVDPTRVPGGMHTVWAYCHVPNGSSRDMTESILAQIERFAPGFRLRILACHAMATPELEAYNQNYVGGDIGGGAYSGLQLLFRPRLTAHPYGTPLARVYLCSSSTPPGAGVHGLCGYHAARAALADFGRP
jgi:phytoene dehydrogenase-like protein